MSNIKFKGDPIEISGIIPNVGEKAADFTFVKDKKVLAHQSGFDGFYMALLEKK